MSGTADHFSAAIVATIEILIPLLMQLLGGAKGILA
jgi:hypothetical protein